ncbi:U24-ctenitoxin-Pn1a-like [Oppia nitens]|uniref:U24-ctenitoxin-Pn1a-like n=1 Tax=Oppia nitens TaxID=1686743 RepID=UPI0023DBC5AA|nr:U24-ctenitoxin-Pn1a-like [Oppia nitens]
MFKTISALLLLCIVANIYGQSLSQGAGVSLGTSVSQGQGVSQGQPISIGVSVGLSDCQRARERAQRSTSVANLIPNCEPNGDYSNLQCHASATTSGGRWCQCWKSDGTVVSQPSRQIRRCECLLEKHGLRSTTSGSSSASGGTASGTVVVGAFVPTCAKHGGYENKQCHGSTGHCWCVNEAGTQIGQKTRGSLNCN